MKKIKNIGKRNFIIAFTILLIGCTLTLILTFYYAKELNSKIQKDYLDDYNEITSKVSEKLYDHSMILLSGKAFFEISEEVTRLKWKKYNELQIKNNLLKGVQGFGFAKIITPNNLNSHIESIRKEGFPNYQIKPIGIRDIYTTIIYLEPFNDMNKRAFGYDMFSEPIRKKAMELARDSNIAAISGKVKLVQESNDDIQFGTLMYLPIYQNGMPINTVQQRREAIIGWVYSPFRMNDLINKIIENIYLKNKDRIHLEIYDETSLAPNNLLFDNNNANNLVHYKSNENKLIKTINFNNHTWTLSFSTKNQTNTLFSMEVVLIFIGGISISFLLFGLFLSVSYTQTKAEQIANNLTIKLRENNLKLDQTNNEITIAKNLVEEKGKNLNDIIKAIPDLIWIKDVNGVYLNCNKRFEDFFGTTEANIIGKTDYDFVTHEMADFFRLNDKIAIDKGKPSINEEVITFANDGHQELIETIKTPIYHKDGSILGILGIGRNITERKKYEEEIEHKNKQLIELNTSKDKFFSIIAHDLKSPFNGFLGLTKIMVENADIFDEDEKKDMFKSMKLSAENLYSLIENLLEWSRMQRGIVNFNPENVFLKYVLEQNFDILRNSANQKNISLINNLPFDLEVVVDLPSINTVFRNLLSNSIKFTPKDGTIEVGIHSKTKDGQSLIYIKDNGIGMSQIMVNKLFKLDQNVSRIGTEGESSTGLGLLLCKEFMEKHNGKIWVESEEGKGTTFFFTLG